MLLVNLYIHVHLLFFIGIGLIFLGFIVWGSMRVCSQFYMKVLCHGSGNDNAVALTFDDGPCEMTSEILDILKEYHVKAAFFCIGNQIEKHPDILKRMHNEGHLIGNHSFNHGYLFDLKCASSMLKELKQTHALVESLTSKRMKLFRPPYGVTNPAVKKAAKKMNYTTVGWSLRSFDTVHKNQGTILARIKKKIKGGDIILLHDNRRVTPELLRNFLIYANKHNIQIKTPDTLLQMDAYE